MPQLRERVAFQERQMTSDGHGNDQSGDFADVFEVDARIRPRLGGEEVLAARLTGRNPMNITVRYSSDTAQVDTDWRVRNTRTGELYNIRSIINPDERNFYLEMLCEAGVAT